MRGSARVRQPEFLTTARVARIVGVSKRTIHNWLKSGKIPEPEMNPENRYYLWTMADVETIRRIQEEEQE